MDNSILNNIKNWGEQNNYPLSCVIYKINKNFPKAFKDVINNYINSIRTTEETLEEINEFAIIFTEDKNVYLEFLCEGRRVIIIQDNTFYNNLPAAKLIKENKFLSDIKELDDTYLNEFISTLPEEFAKRFTETTTLEDMTQKIAKNIIAYIEYLVEERKHHIEKIFFEEASPVTNTHSTRHSTTKNYERKNEEISFDERRKVLDGYHSEYEFEAQARNTKSSYSVKVYKVKNIKYKIVMEPKEGTKYTKVVHIDKTQLSLGEVRQIVIDTLQLDRDQISQSGNITRHSHTDLDEFKKLIEYLATNNDTGINYTTRKKIEEAEGTKKR